MWNLVNRKLKEKKSSGMHRMVHTPAVLILLITGIVALSVVFLFQTAAKALWQKLCQPKDNMHSTSAKTLLLRA
mgnify:FL=1